jgi:hypothetical protein
MKRIVFGLILNTVVACLGADELAAWKLEKLKARL